jgi:hypothetical protein
MISENPAKVYVIESEIVNLSSIAEAKKKRGGQKMGQAFCKLLRTNIEKMSVFRRSTMLLKTNMLDTSLHDVDEIKGVVENENDD